MSRSEVEYLRHILDEAEYLAGRSAATDAIAFRQDETLKRAFVRSIEIIGEATKNLSGALRSRHPQVEWRAMARMRDRLIHGYFGVDYDIVWDVAKNKAPDLHTQIASIIEAEARRPK